MEVAISAFPSHAGCRDIPSDRRGELRSRVFETEYVDSVLVRATQPSHLVPQWVRELWLSGRRRILFLFLHFPPDHVDRRCASGWRNFSVIACLVFVSLCAARWPGSADSGLLDIFPNLSVPSRSQRLTAARAIYRMPVSYSNATTSVQF